MLFVLAACVYFTTNVQILTSNSDGLLYMMLIEILLTSIISRLLYVPRKSSDNVTEQVLSILSACYSEYLVNKQYE